MFVFYVNKRNDKNYMESAMKQTHFIARFGDDCKSMIIKTNRDFSVCARHANFKTLTIHSKLNKSFGNKHKNN